MIEKTAKILITGANGFLGRHIVQELHQQGFNNLLTPSSKEVNLKNWHQTSNFFWFNRPEAVIHCAANVGGIGYNKKYPAQLISDNLHMGLNILEACISRQDYVSVRKVVMVGSVCAMPLDSPVPFKETDLWNGYPEPTNAAYGVAKRALITAGEAFRKQYGLNVINLILANLWARRKN